MIGFLKVMLEASLVGEANSFFLSGAGSELILEVGGA